MVFIQEIENVDKWLSVADERRTALSKFAKDIRFHLDADAGNQVALTMDIHDLEGMRGFSGSDEGQNLMRKGGNARQVAYFTHLP